MSSSLPDHGNIRIGARVTSSYPLALPGRRVIWLLERRCFDLIAERDLLIHVDVCLIRSRSRLCWSAEVQQGAIRRE